MFRYGVYARKSSEDESITEKSIGEQLEAIGHIVTRDGLDVVWHRHESKSAKIPCRRPIYKELVTLIEQGKIDGILCWHVNRLVRNMEEGGKLAQLVIDGIIKEIRTPFAVYRAGDNIMPLVIEAAMATQYSTDLSRDITRAMDSCFRKGEPTYQAPQGYRNGRNSENMRRGVIFIDEPRFSLLRQGWDMLLTENYSVKQILDVLNHSLGYRTKRTKRRGGTPLSYSALSQVFRNPFYAGFMQRKGEMAPGLQPAMVSVDEFERAQAILGRASHKGPKIRSFDYSGLMRCGYCGQQVVGELHTLRDGSLWENYRCADSYLKCTKHGLSLAKLESKFIHGLACLSFAPEVVETAIAELHRHLDARQMELDEVKKQQAQALSQCEERIQKVVEMWISGLLDDKERYRKLVARELSKKNAIMLGNKKRLTLVSHMRSNLDAAQSFLVQDFVNLSRMNSDRKRAILSAVGEITFLGKEKRVEFKVAEILQEVAQFVRSFSAPFEPLKSGSQSQKKPTFKSPVLFGGGNGSESESLHISNTLIEALEGPLFLHPFKE